MIKYYTLTLLPAQKYILTLIVTKSSTLLVRLLRGEHRISTLHS